MNQSDHKVTFTVTEAAELLGISRGHAYELVRRGEVASIKLGRRLLVPRAGLESLLGKLEEVPPPGDGRTAEPIVATAQAPTDGSPVGAYLCIPVTLNNWTPPAFDIR